MPHVDLAACQVHVTADDYASSQAFGRVLERMGARLAAARRSEHCLVVFPEMIGAFLPLAGRLDRVRGAATTDAALTRIALRSLPSIARAMWRGGTWSTQVGFFLAASEEVRAIYREAFSSFASRHRCWVVAGSAILPRNAHGDLSDAFAPQEGKVYNTSYTFAPDGRQVGCTRKVNLVPTLEDVLGLTPGRADELEAVDTPFGRFGTLICYDGFNEPHTSSEPGFCTLTRRLDEQQCVIVAQPAANPWPWDEGWVFADPGERKLRKEQWLDEGLHAQLASERLEHLRFGVTPQLLGGVFDNRFDGRSLILERRADRVYILAEAARADASPESEEVLLRTVELEGLAQTA